jgi:hypothetical protein
MQELLVYASSTGKPFSRQIERATYVETPCRVPAAEVAQTKLAERQPQAETTGRKPKGCPPRVPQPTQATPATKTQRNFTDPKSRIMKDGATKSFVPAYNAQAAVDGTAQIIVAADVTQEANYKQQLGPMVTQVAANCGAASPVASADSGYFSAANVTDRALTGIDLHAAPDRRTNGEAPLAATVPATGDATVIAAMRTKLQTAAGHAFYVLRKATFQPVFRQIEDMRRFRHPSFRGLAKVQAEWLLICLMRNLLKQFRMLWRLLAA